MNSLFSQKPLVFYAVLLWAFCGLAAEKPRDAKANARPVLDAGDSYRTPDARRSLKRIGGLLAVSPKPGVSARDLIASPAFSGHALERQTPAGFLVLAAPAGNAQEFADAPAHKLAQARNALGVLAANPVFMDETGRQLILAQQVIVKLKEGKALPPRARPVRRLAGTTDHFILSMPSASAEEIFQEVEALFHEPEIEWAEPDTIGEMTKHLVPNDPLFLNQWHLHNTGQGGGLVNADVNAVEAWDTTRGSPQVVIAIMDDAVEINHPDLNANIFQNPAELPNGIDDDNNGYIDDLNGWDFVSNDNNPSPALPEDVHGTACAGVAAAVGNNGQGVAGIAYNCRILPVRMFGVPASTLAESIYYTAGRAANGTGRWRGADIISMSLGLPQSAVATTALQWASTNGRGGKGCAIFVASGNSASRWQTVTLEGIPPGAHTYEWIFRKDISISAGADTVWLDGVTFPGGMGESFESATLPAGWTSFGNANWFTVQDGVGGNHALTGWNGAAARAARSGDIGDNQTSGLRVTKTTPGGPLSFRVWVSAEWDPFSYYDHLEFRIDGVVRFRVDDDPSIAPVTAVGYPANLTNVIAVGASTDFDFRSDYSCYGPELAFVAPSGGGFIAVWTTDRTGSEGYDLGDYTRFFSGTSSACPLAAGAAGLALTVNSNLSPRNLRRLMQATCDKIGNVTYTGNTNLFYGWGRINAARSLSNAVPRILSIQSNAANATIRFQSLLGWSYNLERASGLAGTWTPVQSNVAGTGNVVALNDPRAATAGVARFYRLRVLP